MDKELRKAVREYLLELLSEKNKSPKMAATIAELYRLLLE
mgnify:FL=1